MTLPTEDEAYAQGSMAVADFKNKKTVSSPYDWGAVSKSGVQFADFETNYRPLVRMWYRGYADAKKKETP